MPLTRHAVGKQMYVWSRNPFGKSSDAVVISAHGRAAFINGMSRVRHDIQLHYYCPHGAVLIDPTITSMLNGDARQFGDAVLARNSQDYVLSKYQNSANSPRRNGTGESYMSIRNLPEDLEALMEGEFGEEVASIRAKLEFAAYSGIRPEFTSLERSVLSERIRVKHDILTIRDRALMSSPRLSTLLNELWSSGFNYRHVHCSFCRYVFTFGKDVKHDPLKLG